ncbi:GNAT family N-acetyltransferase [Clostridium vitabionis]|uniref:GNAT family N-acetyltransferase n=1 Tax=Clostridium vitabionis TaxID=2784388 RepID=UPI00188D1DCF|nr:GNAT family N-acetyltransferase [Clostridium vitabionis]
MLQQLTLEEMQRLYETRMQEDFPQDEMKPFSRIAELFRQGRYLGYGMAGSKGHTDGYALFVRMEMDGGENYLFDYLAIDKNQRGTGIGTRFLGELAEAFRGAHLIVGECEDPDKAEDEGERRKRERRIRFYGRNGIHPTGVTSKVCGVDYRVMEVVSGSRHSDREVRRVLDAFYRQIFPDSIYREIAWGS